MGAAAGERPTFEGPRPARHDERDELIEMINFVFRTSQGRAPTIATDWPHVYEVENLANVSVISDPLRVATEQAESAAVKGKVVASTGVWATDVVLGDVTLRVGGINCVGTLPEYRRHGLGSQVVIAAHQTMRDMGCHVGLLATGITNWYRRMGWENAGMVRTYAVNRGNVDLLPRLRPSLRMRMVEVGAGDEVVLAQVAAADWAAVVRLRDAARCGARRSVARLRQLVCARRVERLLLAEPAGGATGDGGAPVAYLLLRDQEVIEWGGAADDVLGLVAACFEQMDDRTVSTSQRVRDGNAAPLRALKLQTPAPYARVPQPVTELLDARGIPFHNDYMGMLYVVDPQAVLDAYGLDGVQVETRQLEDGDEVFVVHVGGESLTLDRRQLAKLFFGPERLGTAANGLLPLPIWQWSLEMV